ncbi:MAG TPA: hypothetical protein VF720_06825 [Candidatus Eisenbacteria bacterium]
MAVLILSCARPGSEAPPTGPGPVSGSVAASACPACAALRSSPSAPGGVADTLGTDEAHPPADPHGTNCAVCHHPGGRHLSDTHDWLPTCTTSECHPKAWTETVFHRVEPAVFRDCTNCHRPHTWKASGEDCRSCHGPRGTPAAVTPMAAFPHERHESLACTTCHAVGEGRHATPASPDPARCQSCHHGPPAVASCGNCHAPDELAGRREVPVMLTLARNAAPRSRRLGFDHARHRELACATCHAAGHETPVRVDCASCHRRHDLTHAACGTCHEAPPAGAHRLALHETGCAGTACHDDIGLTRLTDRREVCLACHADQVRHQAGKVCASCHLVSLGHGAGS